MVAKEKIKRGRKLGHLFSIKTKGTGELKSINFNDIMISHVDSSELTVCIGGERVRTIGLTPLDAEKLIAFLEEYVDQFS